MAPSPTLTSVVAATDDQRAAITAADVLFTEHGINPVALDEVAAQAHLTRARLEAAYASKRDLLVAVLAWKHQEWSGRLADIGHTHDDPRDEILAIFTYLEESFADPTWRGCTFINGYGELGRQDPGIARLAEQHFDEVERHISVLCTRAGIPNQIAEALTLLIQGARAESGIHHTVQPARAARTGAALLMSIYQSNPLARDLF